MANASAKISEVSVSVGLDDLSRERLNDH